ncbi:MAG: TniB family NTP-binding protein, partial [Limnothrix sp.]
MADCPFFAGSTITDPRYFVGRREALKLLSDRMQGSQPTSINVVGRHKTGKSSLLVHFQQTYGQRVTNPDGYRVAYLSLQKSACETEEKFYREIAKKLGQGEQPLDRQGFTAWVQGLRGLGILPVLCVDNFEELLE